LSRRVQIFTGRRGKRDARRTPTNLCRESPLGTIPFRAGRSGWACSILYAVDQRVEATKRIRHRPISIIMAAAGAAAAARAHAHARTHPEAQPTGIARVILRWSSSRYLPAAMSVASVRRTLAQRAPPSFAAAASKAGPTRRGLARIIRRLSERHPAGPGLQQAGRSEAEGGKLDGRTSRVALAPLS
jgi:hypothetical protein